MWRDWNRHKEILKWWQKCVLLRFREFYWKRGHYITLSVCLSFLYEEGSGGLYMHKAEGPLCMIYSCTSTVPVQRFYVIVCATNMMDYNWTWCSSLMPCLPVWWTGRQCPSTLGACRCVYSTSSARSRSCAESGLHYWKPSVPCQLHLPPWSPPPLC